MSTAWIHIPPQSFPIYNKNLPGGVDLNLINQTLQSWSGVGQFGASF